MAGVATSPTDPAVHSGETLERATLRRVSRRLIPFLLLLYLVAYIDRVNVGFAALQMNQDLGFSAAMYGFGAGIFFLGYTLFEVPSNIVLARVGARRWIARIMVTWGLVSVAMMFVRSATSFYALRFLLGVAEAGFFPGIIYFLCNWYPPEQRARALGWFTTAIPLSIVVGGPLAGVLLGLDGLFGLRGWQILFLVEGLPAVLLGFAVLFFLDDGPQDARWLTAPQKAWLAGRIQAEHDQARERHRVGVLRSLAHPLVWALGLLSLVAQAGSYGLTLWMPQILKSLTGLSNLEVGLLSAIPFAAAALGMVLVGAHSDRTGERLLHVAGPMLLAAIGFAAAAVVRSPWLALAMLTIAAVGDYSSRGPFWALPGRFLAGPAAAAGIALINTLGAMGGFVGPYAIGLLKSASGSFTAGLLLIAGLLLAGCAGSLALRASRTLATPPV
jgi:MFS transporter, ACS family, tartrate transporter